VFDEKLSKRLPPEGSGQVGDGSAPQGLCYTPIPQVIGKHDNRQLGGNVAHLAQRIEPVSILEIESEQDEVWIVLRELFDRTGDGGRLQRLVAERLDKSRGRFAIRGIAVDDQDCVGYDHLRLAPQPAAHFFTDLCDRRHSRYHTARKQRVDKNVAGAARQPLTFRAVLQGDSGMFVEVPPEILQALGPARRPAVRVVINGVELRTTIAVYGGRSLIGVRREIREAAQVNLGETLELAVELDTAARGVELPDDLAAVLAADPDARRLFDSQSFTNRKEYVGWVLQARTASTRQRRIADTPELLKSGRAKRG
jgi:hypothetical protein